MISVGIVFTGNQHNFVEKSAHFQVLYKTRTVLIQIDTNDKWWEIRKM